MPKLALMPSGIKAHVPARSCAGNDSVRGECNGWSEKAARRNDLFLRSVEFTKLNGFGYACSLTFGHCPPDHEAMRNVIIAFIQRMRRLGMIRMHWVVEWQRRGVPHLHCVVFFPTRHMWCAFNKWYLTSGETIIAEHWLAVASVYGSKSEGQHVKPVTHIQGWFGYLAKHGARGAFHYQRMKGTLPDGWQKTGRMWGKSGEWNTTQTDHEISHETFYAMRRFMRRWLVDQGQRSLKALTRSGDVHKIAEARKRLTFLRRLYRPTIKRRDGVPEHERIQLTRNIGRVLPISEWCPPEIILSWLTSTCRASEWVDPATGEILPYWEW